MDQGGDINNIEYSVVSPPLAQVKVVAAPARIYSYANSASAIEKPSTAILLQSCPNPFNPSTTIEFSLPERSFVKLTIHNVLGQLVETLVDGVKEAGHHRFVWDAQNFPSGVYLYRLEMKSFVQTKKMILVK